MSVERGHDPRNFTLMAFGGAGPLHARDVAAELGMSEVLVPPAPGIVCAQGLLVSDQKEDFVASVRLPLSQTAMAEAAKMIGNLAELAHSWFESERLPDEGRSMELSLDLRYVGQNFELIVPAASGANLTAQDLPDAETLANLFFDAHDRAYGFHDASAPIEIINFRMTARGRLFEQTKKNERKENSGLPEAESTRTVWFDSNAGIETPVYRREKLYPGLRFEGPAIVDQLDATTPIFPGDRVEVLADGSILIRLQGA